MLAELKKGLGMERKCLCSKTTTVLSEWTVPEMYDVSLSQFQCIKNKKNISYRSVCILYINVYITYISYSSLMSTSGIVKQRI